uniref:DM5 domain-containing protein n=1 Tax=Anopheles merus TaxID=30066 RepID=A0A182V7T8_ANOME
MKCFVVLSALALALASARPEGYSYFTPHGTSSGHGGHSATSSASVLFTSAGTGASAAASAVDDCEEPAHEQLSPFQHSQVHFYAPQTATHGESSSYLMILPTYTKQKHYKIIFIKAPSPPTVSKVVLPQPPVNEEKTLVYVLHKKPELEQEIVVTTVHSVASSSTLAPSSSYVSSTASSNSAHKAQSIKVTNIGLSGYSSGGTGYGSSTGLSSSLSSSSSSGRQRGSKKSCGKCSKTNSAPLAVGGTLDAFVSNVY